MAQTRVAGPRGPDHTSVLSTHLTEKKCQRPGARCSADEMGALERRCRKNQVRCVCFTAQRSDEWKKSMLRLNELRFDLTCYSFIVFAAERSSSVLRVTDSAYCTRPSTSERHTQRPFSSLLTASWFCPDRPSNSSEFRKASPNWQPGEELLNA